MNSILCVDKCAVLCSELCFFRAALCSSINYCDVKGGAIQWEFEFGDKFHSTEVPYFKSL